MCVCVCVQSVHRHKEWLRINLLVYIRDTTAPEVDQSLFRIVCQQYVRRIYEQQDQHQISYCVH